jgi:2-oxoglutarate dehydrogenase E2 component (dihydrolipoamide succinyltransferase)
MDPHSEHGDTSGPPGLASATASDERADAPELAESADAPPEAAPSPAQADAQPAGGDAAPESGAMPSNDPDPGETLSPAVRRLVRQYDLDITGVYGSGPAGKIRVGDIIGMLDGRAEPRARASEPPSRVASIGPEAAARHAPASTSQDVRATASEIRQPPVEASAAPEASMPTTTVFECDLSRVLTHRKRERQGDVELLLASYFIAACLEALSAVPEVAAGLPGSTQPWTGEYPRLGVSLAASDGSLRRALVGTAATAPDERLRAVDAQLRAPGDEDLRAAHILIHYYGASGSLLTTPTPIGSGHVASVGVGRVRREIVVKTIDGQEAPRAAALCYLTLTFRPDRIALERANRFVSECVRVLEHWPTEPTAA